MLQSHFHLAVPDTQISLSQSARVHLSFPRGFYSCGVQIFLRITEAVLWELGEDAHSSCLSGDVHTDNTRTSQPRLESCGNYSTAPKPQTEEGKLRMLAGLAYLCLPDTPKSRGTLFGSHLKSPGVCMYSCDRD